MRNVSKASTSRVPQENGDRSGTGKPKKTMWARFKGIFKRSSSSQGGAVGGGTSGHFRPRNASASSDMANRQTQSGDGASGSNTPVTERRARVHTPSAQPSTSQGARGEATGGVGGFLPGSGVVMKNPLFNQPLPKDPPRKTAEEMINEAIQRFRNGEQELTIPRVVSPSSDGSMKPIPRFTDGSSVTGTRSTAPFPSSSSSSTGTRMASSAVGLPRNRRPATGQQGARRVPPKVTVASSLGSMPSGDPVRASGNRGGYRGGSNK